MAAGAALCVGFVVGNVFMTGHAGLAIRPYAGLMNVVAGLALRVAFAQRDIAELVKTGQLSSFVTARAAGLRRYRAAVRLVTSAALPMSLRASEQLLVVTGATGDHTRRLMGRPLMAGFAARMTQISAS
jgi:hypothetical protein